MEKRFSQLQPLIQELFELSDSPGLSVGVLHQGTPLMTTHFGRLRASQSTPPNDDTLYTVASITKLMTAGVISNLVDQGLLDWDTPIREYLPEFGERKDIIGQEATVTDFLANRSGISAQNTFWGTMNEDILTNRETLPKLACHIPAIGEFRNSFIYSTWGYGLVTCAIERVSGKLFSACVDEYIFQPLGMHRSTTNVPQVDNVAFKHWVGNDGVAHEFPWSLDRGWSDETGLSGAVAARSSIKELLVMYQSLLNAYDHQTRNNVDNTPGSPFRYTRRLLYPHIGVGTASPEKQGYCLGTYRMQLPGDISTASYNSILLQQKNNRVIGKSHTGRIIFHQIATFTGYNGSMLLDPLSHTAIVVLVNSLPSFDITDILGQLLLGTILGEEDPTNFLSLARSVKDVNKSVYSAYAASLAKKKSKVALTFPLTYYEGEYWNEDRIICYHVHVLGEDQIRINVKGSTLTNYILHSWGGDLFVLVPDREKELSQSMWPFTSLKTRMFRFNCGPAGVLSFTWHHDLTPGSTPETFAKDNLDVTAKL
ncbi:hypothetical protein HYFRA_00007466 [Hymenoscyphus fraxineus]|uniref:Beta-lactamase-related domain-containing protein n=1 Tax=Hymenoscyphus fraxineus TaxID=746836 RepID=A0A9N9KPB8_9HELO|nr:hypothetical protein HYFRA_00007466 [Hymenoscyphus fraxineus]